MRTVAPARSRPRAVAIALLVALAVPPAGAGATQPRDSENPGGPTTVVAGDLDGDGTTDLLRVTPGLLYRSVTVFSGRTGATSWSRELPGATVVLPGRVGTAGAPGVLAVVADDSVAAAVVALDRNGSLAWTARVGEPAGRRATYVSPIAGTPGGGTDLLFTRRTDAGGSTFVVMDGSDGTMRDLGVTVPDEGPTLRVGVVADTDGDRRDEIAAIHSDDGLGVHVTLVSGAGRRLWSADANALTVGYRPVAVGDLTGDGRGDVAIDWGPNGWADLEPARQNSVYVFDGATGRLLWQARGLSIYTTTSRAGRVRVVLGSVLFDPSDETHTGIEATGFDARGRAVWKVRRLLGYKNDELHRAPLLGPIGDVDADGTTDLGYSIELSRANGMDEGVIAVRTGAVRRDPAPRLVATGALDGRGTDRLALSSRQPGITAWRGDAPARLWEVTYERPLSLSDPERALVAHLDGDRCVDVVMPARNGWMAVSGATGTPLWTIDVEDPPRVRSRKQYAKTC